jgi:mannose-6-phosphate isomerase
MLGELISRFKRFPLLLKFLDVQKMLSVQVHPRDDQTALIPKGDTGKTEAWVVLEAQSGGRVYAGLKAGTTPDTLRTLSNQTADDYLPSFTPVAGQGILIEAGTIHSLGDGVVVFEVQENSDVTFRLYDWDHVDPKTNKKRDLQIDKALACIDFAQGTVTPVVPVPETAEPIMRERLFDSPHFRMWRIQAAVPFTLGSSRTPHVLVCIDGAGCVQFGGAAFEMTKGTVILLPAALGVCCFQPEHNVTMLDITVPEI